MHVFMTGASGWIGSATVVELLAAGHRVTGLARSTAAAADRLRARGVEPLPGDLDDLGSLRRGAAGADAVIHLANKHDFADPASSNRAERAAVQTIGDELLGSTGRSSSRRGSPSARADGSPSRMSRRSADPTLRAAAVRRWGWTSPNEGCTVSRCASRRPCTVRVTTASSPRSCGSLGSEMPPRTSATAPTAGRRCTWSTPRSWSSVPSRRRRPGRWCTRSPKRGCRRGRSRSPSAKGSGCR